MEQRVRSGKIHPKCLLSGFGLVLRFFGSLVLRFFGSDFFALHKKIF